ncbi:MAG: hypothetical protein QXR98_03115 [Fervidicoccaceae archaeon]
MWWRRGLYPGNGPWSDLPPWERPGYWYGRGWCYGLPFRYTPTYARGFFSKEEELRYLEDLRKYITDFVLKDIDSRIEELKKSQ